MDRYIGLDVHASSTTIAVVGPSGKRLGSRVVETNGQALLEWFKSQSGTLHVCFEGSRSVGGGRFSRSASV